MSRERHERLGAIFNEVRRLPADERTEALGRLCSDDHALRAEIEAMLQEYEQTGLLGSDSWRSAIGDLAVDDESAPRPLPRVPRYQVDRVLGEGGMGVVYEAEQLEPVRRRVALKVIRPGLDSREVSARFQAERQTIARLDHPFIARVFDAGSTEDGLPYFAMELIDGQSITTYCRERSSDLAGRLELFRQVCEALEHAHQRGIIHRDLKSSNILVVEQARKPTVRIIDFGIAKVLDQDIASKTLATKAGELFGTLGTMSPEQLDSSDDIDTRADVYALGVLLYQLLTDELPIDIRGMSLTDSLQTLRTQEPLRPSVRAQTSGGPIPTRELRGDLDWITLRALEKDRERRYPSAAALAEDIERHLRHEPIAAGPPTTRYILGKFVRRHRILVTSLASVIAVLTIAVVVVSLALSDAIDARNREETEKQAAIDARHEALDARDAAARQLAKAEAINEFFIRILSEANPGQNPDGRRVTVLEALQVASQRIEGRFADQPEVEAPIRMAIGNALTTLGDWATARVHIERAIELFEVLYPSGDQLLASARCDLGRTWQHSADYDRAEELLEQALAWQVAHLEEGHTDIIRTKTYLALQRFHQGEFDSGIALCEQAIEASRQNLAASGDDDVAALTQLINAHELKATLLRGQGEYSAAESEFEVTLALARRLPDRERLTLAFTLSNYAGFLGTRHADGDAERLIALDEEALGIFREVLGDEHREIALIESNIADSLKMLGRFDEAEALYQSSQALERRILGNDHPDVARSLQKYGHFLALTRRFDEAIEMTRESMRIIERHFGPDHQEVSTARQNYAATLLMSGRFSEAETEYREALPIARKLGEAHPDVQKCIISLTTAQLQQGKRDEAQRTLMEHVEKLREQVPSDHPGLKPATYYLGRIEYMLGHGDRAIELFEECLANPARFEMNHDRSVAELQALHGDILIGRGELEEAEALLLESWKRLEPLPPSYVTGEVRQLLDKLYTAWNKPEKAAEWR